MPKPKSARTDEARAAENLAKRFRTDNSAGHATSPLDLKLPAHWAYLGECTQIDYKSDKFGKEEEYTHETESEPVMLSAESGDYTLLLVVGKKSKFKVTKRGIVG